MRTSIDCMHFWKNCLAAWREQFKEHSGMSTLDFEVVAYQDLRI